MSSLPSLSGLSKSELSALVTELGWQPFTATQIESWLYKKFSGDISEWTNLSTERRARLAQRCRVPLLELTEHLRSQKDPTERFLYATADGQPVESVLMRFRDRSTSTVCISSQVGCSVGCPFCATGRLGFRRNLTAAEIVDQVIYIERLHQRQIDNLVYMGQGEPLLNIAHVIKSIEIFRGSAGIGVRNITVSTSGIVPGIDELGESRLQINLAVSLHSAIQTKRETLVPIAKRWKMFDLIQSLNRYYRQTHRRITFEHILIDGINSSAADANALCDMIRDLEFPCLVNLIPYNSTTDEFRTPSRATVEAFRQIVERSGRKVTVRLTLGDDIAASCGQLGNRRT